MFSGNLFTVDPAVNRQPSSHAGTRRVPQVDFLKLSYFPRKLAVFLDLWKINYACRCLLNSFSAFPATHLPVTSTDGCTVSDRCLLSSFSALLATHLPVTSADGCTVADRCLLNSLSAFPASHLPVTSADGCTVAISDGCIVADCFWTPSLHSRLYDFLQEALMAVL